MLGSVTLANTRHEEAIRLVGRVDEAEIQVDDVVAAPQREPTTMCRTAPCPDRSAPQSHAKHSITTSLATIGRPLT